MSMICERCYKSFDGKGAVCPDCIDKGEPIKPSAERVSGSSSFIKKGESIYPAGFVGRIVAFLFDSLLVGVIIGLVIAPLFEVTVGAWITKAIAAIASANQVGFMLSAMIASFASSLAAFLFFSMLVPLYYTISESSKMQGTIGKKLLGLVVTDINGKKLTASRAFGRAMARSLGAAPIILGILVVILIPSKITAQLCLSFFALGGIVQLVMYPAFFFTQYRQGLHDLVSSCIVQESDEGASTGGFIAALTGIVLFLSLMLYFHENLKAYESRLNGSRFQSLNRMDFSRKTIRSDETEAATATESPNYRQIIPFSQEEEEELPSEGMQASISGQVIKFEKVKAMLGVTMKTLSLYFFKDADQKKPDFRVNFYYRWPISLDCGMAEMEKYEIIYLGAQAGGNFNIQSDKKLFAFAPGSTPAGGAASFICSVDGKNLSVSAYFRGKASSPTDTKHYAWSVKVDSVFPKE